MVMRTGPRYLMGPLEQLARTYTDKAIHTLGSLMNNDIMPPIIRMRCAEILLDRGWGKPTEQVHVDAPQQLQRIVREIVHVPPGGVQFDEPKDGEPLDVTFVRAKDLNS
jgi:hypothetical protein